METPRLNPQEPQDWRERLLFRVRHSTLYPVAVGLLSAISAATGLYPFGPVYVVAIAIAPGRWKAVYLASCIGATLGVLALAGVVEHYGIHIVDSLFPGLEHRSDWLRYTHWVMQYGWIAVMAFAALPIPQMPVLLLAALSHTSLAAIAIAILLGKLVKYGVYGLVTLAALRGIRESG